MGHNFKRCFSALLISLFCCTVLTSELFAKTPSAPALSAKSAVVIDPKSGDILYGKNPHLKLLPASTTKLMTAVIVLEKLPLNKKVMVSRQAVNAPPSKAGLVAGVEYTVLALLVATLVSSSNDAAVALAEGVAGSEKTFVQLMNLKAGKLGMNNTRFVNATGLPSKGRYSKQYSTAYDLAKLMCYAAKDKRIDEIMGITKANIRGSDRKAILITSHNKMLWRTPKFIKGKTGWTFASRHTFVGTDYGPKKNIIFAMLGSKKPWIDIQKLANFGILLKARS